MDLHDTWLDLKLAFWETQLSENYPEAHLTYEFDVLHGVAQIEIQFQNLEDHVQWCLSNNYLTH